MNMTRRELIKIGAGAGLTATVGGWGTLLAQQPTIMTTIPSTGEQVPCVGIGTVDFGDNPDSGKLAVYSNTLEAFYQHGGRLVDTSPNYGNAEEVLGKIMQNLGIRDKVFLATKVDREDQEAGKGRMEASFRNLGGNVIDLMQVHNLRGTDVELETMRAWKEQGRFRYVGITTHTSSQYKEFEQAMRKHKPDFIQVNYSVADRGAGERILPLAQDIGAAVLVNRPFGKGDLFRTVREKPLPPWAADIDATSWGQLFLKYIVSHPAATIPIPGTSKPHHAVDNMGAMTGRLPDPGLRREIERFMDTLL